MDNIRSIIDTKYQQCKLDWYKPITDDIRKLFEKLLIPVAHKAFKNVRIFENALKEETYEDSKYVKFLEKEVDECETQKAEFSNEYDLLLKECLSNDIMCDILFYFDNIDEQTELQCLYLEKCQECENLELELSKSKTQQTDKRFANLEQYCIELELALQHEKETNVCKNSWGKQPLILGNKEKALKEKNDSLIVELNQKTLEINDLKAQLQDKMIPNVELRESWNKMKERQALISKPSVQKTAILQNTTNGSKLKPRNSYQQPRNWPPSMSSRVTNKAIHIAEKPRNQNPFLKSKDLACPTCKKSIYTANHDACILKYLFEVNSCASAKEKDAQSHKTTKRYIPVEKKSDVKQPDRQIPT
ncbi:hypothetical protein Tco_0305262 [Tanacetum coccineum]